MIKLKYKCSQFVTNYCCSIVNGICLGLAGKTQVLNRSTSVGEFVKIGEENASIEVELYHPEEGNITVLRQFNKAGKSNWLLNGKKSGVREVERKVASLRIQVDNLCQFLPQDRIHEFSNLNSKDLLEKTVEVVEVVPRRVLEISKDAAKKEELIAKM